MVSLPGPPTPPPLSPTSKKPPTAGLPDSYGISPILHHTDTMSQNNLRSAFRTLARHKGYTTINILGLALGLCACLTIYNIVSYEFSFDRSHPDADRIYRLGSRVQEDNGNGSLTTGYGEAIPAPAPEALRSDVPHIETLAAYYTYNVDI